MKNVLQESESSLVTAAATGELKLDERETAIAWLAVAEEISFGTLTAHIALSDTVHNQQF